MEMQVSGNVSSRMIVKGNTINAFIVPQTIGEHIIAFRPLKDLTGRGRRYTVQRTFSLPVFLHLFALQTHGEPAQVI